MNKKTKLSIVLFIILMVIGLLYIIPLMWILASSLRPAGSLYEYANPLTLRTFFPEKLTLENFIHIFTEEQFGVALGNSLLVAFAAILLGVVVNSMAGFSLAKFEFPGNKLIFGLILITFMVPFESIVIPLFLQVRRMGFINTYAALILPAVGNGLGIFMFKQFFEEIPNELLEAARVEGASWFKIFCQLVIPLSLPAVVTVIVMMFLFQWNALFWPLVATHSSKYEVVQVAIAAHRMTEETHWASLFSSAIAGSLPPMLLFFALQKYYVQGITRTGIK
ncbi:MAG TPA: carbohydrate ABC transporter permease [Firmicutes bacterium]|nr:carbohydrate ABC transporter permease [Bacillota bacterium]HBT15482.1 carbohydrate ABC transporter permease [Bacillota bacterium]